MLNEKQKIIEVCLLEILPVLISLKADGVISHYSWKDVMYSVALTGAIFAIVGILMMLVAIKNQCHDDRKIYRIIIPVYFGFSSFYVAMMMASLFLRATYFDNIVFFALGITFYYLCTLTTVLCYFFTEIALYFAEARFRSFAR